MAGSQSTRSHRSKRTRWAPGHAANVMLAALLYLTPCMLLMRLVSANRYIEDTDHFPGWKGELPTEPVVRKALSQHPTGETVGYGEDGKVGLGTNQTHICLTTKGIPAWENAFCLLCTEKPGHCLGGLSQGAHRCASACDDQSLASCSGGRLIFAVSNDEMPQVSSSLPMRRMFQRLDHCHNQCA